jgi:hypothetical protein
MNASKLATTVGGFLRGVTRREVRELKRTLAQSGSGTGLVQITLDPTGGNLRLRRAQRSERLV